MATPGFPKKTWKYAQARDSVANNNVPMPEKVFDFLSLRY